MKWLFLGLLVVLLSVSLFLSGCSSQEIYMCPDGSIAGDQEVSGQKAVYICPDGKTVRSSTQCNYPLQSTISQEDAQNKAQTYVQGYVQDHGWSSRLVNTYLDNQTWIAQVVVSKYDAQPFETTVHIDGQKGVVTCAQNCDYARRFES